MSRTTLFITALSLLARLGSLQGANRRQTAEQLTQESDVVIIGTVDLKTSHWGDDSRIYTDVTVTPDLTVKGADQGTVIVRVLGGTVGDTRMTVSDSPEFEEGERAVLFLRAGKGYFEVAGRAAGKYTVGSDDAAEAIDRAFTEIEKATGRKQFDKRSRATALLSKPVASALETTTTTTSATATTACYVVDGAKWGSASATYTFAASIPAGWYAALDASAATWSNAGVGFRLVRDAGSTNELSLIDLVSKYGTSYSNTYALATTWSSTSTNLITRATIEVNTRWQWSASGQANMADVQNILTHEFGHWMRLKDLYSPTTCGEVTMWGSAMLGETKKRTLEADDIAGFRSLYGAGTALSAPTLGTPVNGATGVSVTPAMSWSAVSGATSYDVYFGASSTPQFVANVAGTTYSPGTLASGGTYFWRVVAKNSSATASSATWSFTTAATSSLAAPVLKLPANYATGVAVTPALSWNAVTGATAYDVYFGTAATPQYVATVSGSSYSPGTLTSGATYYWRVVAKNATASASSAVWRFTTAASGISAPVLVSPANGATGVSLSPVFRWNAVTGATAYDVYVGTTSTPSLIGTVSTTSVTVNGFTTGRTYYWKIVARGAAGSASSPVWYFRTY